MLKRYIRPLAILLLLAMLFAACGKAKEVEKKDPDKPDIETPDVPDPKPNEGYISLESEEMTVKVGESGKIQATVTPTNKDDDTTLSYVTFSSCIKLW